MSKHHTYEHKTYPVKAGIAEQAHINNEQYLANLF